MASSRKMPPVTGYGLSMLGLELFSAMQRRRKERNILGVDVEDTASATKALIPAAKVDSSDAVLAQHGGAHDTWLDSDIEVGLVENLDRMLRQDAGNGDELGVPGAIQGSIRLVHAAANDLAVLDKDTADRCFVALEGELRLWR